MFRCPFPTDPKYRKCDAIWENPPHVAQVSFAEINKLILKLLCFSLFSVNPRPTKPFFVTWFTKGGWLPPPYELEIDRPKV